MASTDFDFNTDDTSKKSKTSPVPTPVAEQPKKQSAQPTIKNQNGDDVPFFAAPRSHSGETVSRNAVKAMSQSKNREDPGLPEVLSLDESKVRYVPMPDGGLSALVDSLHPDDLKDLDKMDAHTNDLLLLNRGTLRDDTSYQVGQMVRVPS